MGSFKDRSLAAELREGMNHDSSAGKFREAENGLAKGAIAEEGLFEVPWAPEGMSSASTTRHYSLGQQQQRPKTKKKTMEKAKRIDVTSRYIFPFAFASFNVAYWSHYLTQAQQEYEDNVLSM